jgi:exopolyphosphatase/guanosine-5'-triphosphate,3'-diphosphate pyrophosphatase
MRTAVLDLGTNTFHLLVADRLPDGNWKRVFKTRRVVRLGEGAIHRNEIAPDPFERGLRTLRDFSRRIESFSVDRVVAVATSAVRSAVNGNDFVRAVRKETGIRVRVISGEEEADYIAKGVRACLDWGQRTALIMDIGGGSTEFILADDRSVLWKASFNIGAARVLAQFRPSDPIHDREVQALQEHFRQVLKPLRAALIRHPPELLIGSSGSFDTFAAMLGHRHQGRDYLKGRKSYRFDLMQYRALHRDLLRSNAVRREQMPGLIRMRRDLIVLASICTSTVLDLSGVKEMMVSRYALKEGVLASPRKR